MSDDLSTKARQVAAELQQADDVAMSLLEWHDEDRDIEVEVLDDGVYVYFYDKGTGQEWTKPLGDLIALLDQLTEEVARLDHLHKLDHALADQWHERAEKAEAERDRLLDANADLRFRFPDSQRPDGPKALAQAERERDFRLLGPGPHFGEEQPGLGATAKEIAAWCENLNQEVGLQAGLVERVIKRAEKAEALLDEIEKKVREVTRYPDAYGDEDVLLGFADRIAAILSKRENQERENQKREGGTE